VKQNASDSVSVAELLHPLLPSCFNSRPRDHRVDNRLGRSSVPQVVAGAEVKFPAQGLGEQDPPGLIESKLRGHSGSLKWENPLVKPANALTAITRLTTVPCAALRAANPSGVHTTR
jgi:hypothetical protein